MDTHQSLNRIYRHVFHDRMGLAVHDSGRYLVIDAPFGTALLRLNPDHPDTLFLATPSIPSGYEHRDHTEALERANRIGALTKTAHLIVADDGDALAAVEMPVAGADLLPSPEHVQQIAPRALNSLAAVLKLWVDDDNYQAMRLPEPCAGGSPAQSSAMNAVTNRYLTVLRDDLGHDVSLCHAGCLHLRHRENTITFHLSAKDPEYLHITAPLTAPIEPDRATTLHAAQFLANSLMYASTIVTDANHAFVDIKALTAGNDILPTREHLTSTLPALLNVAQGADDLYAIEAQLLTT